jgi:hypothetical protein
MDVHLRVFLELSNPQDSGRLATYLYCAITMRNKRQANLDKSKDNSKIKCVNA